MPDHRITVHRSIRGQYYFSVEIDATDPNWDVFLNSTTEYLHDWCDCTNGVKAPTADEPNDADVAI